MSSEREDRMESALNEIRSWANAYPLTVFSEPDFKKADKVLAAAGISMTAMHGTWARYLVEGIGEIAAKALTE